MVSNHTPEYPRQEELFALDAPAFLKKVSITNYRSIGEATLDLGRFTVLAGANGAGKSNVVDVFRFVAEALSLGLYAALERRAGIQAVRHRVPSRGGRQRTVRLAFELDLPRGMSADYSFTLISGARGAYRVGEEVLEMWSGGGDLFGKLKMRNGELQEKPLLLVSEPSVDQENLAEFFLPASLKVGRESLALPVVGTTPGFRPVLLALREMRAYSIVPDLLREPQDSDEGRVLHVDGRNATSVWRDLSPKDRGELIDLLGHAVPGIDDVRTQRYGRKRGFEFRQSSGAGRIMFEGHQMSDGTIRLFGILLALLQPRSSSVIAIEEPEASLHIAALEALVAVMRERVDSGQVLLTTHSPELIDFVSPDELRLVRREDGNTIVAPVAEHSKQAVLDDLFTLGELHRAGGLRATDEPLATPP
ncbi:MAG: AAA family ATPase [Solirubrobacterales bacterium]